MTSQTQIGLCDQVLGVKAKRQHTMKIELWFHDESEYRDPPYLVGTYLSQAAADEARAAFVKRMTNPSVPYRFEFKTVETP
jgi:hypothetical protein